MFSPAPCGASGYFNPRSPCGERRLYAESRLAEYKFQSTLPVRGATAASIFASNIPSISIHAPRAGSDGEITLYEAAEELFQSTLPVRGATKSCIKEV